jgi:hypothetical protein
MQPADLDRAFTLSRVQQDRMVAKFARQKLLAQSVSKRLRARETVVRKLQRHITPVTSPVQGPESTQISNHTDLQ